MVDYKLRYTSEQKIQAEPGDGPSRERSSMFIYIALILAGLVVDQLTKSLAIWFLSDVTTVPLIPNVFHLTYIENPGIAFSFLSGKQTFIIIVTAVCIAALCYVLTFCPKRNAGWSRT